jgi:hypothetical protein
MISLIHTGYARDLLRHGMLRRFAPYHARSLDTQRVPRLFEGPDLAAIFLMRAGLSMQLCELIWIRDSCPGNPFTEKWALFDGVSRLR